MTCRRCGKEMPVGHKSVCPFCGVHLEPYITPRSSMPKAPQKKNRRATMLSFISIGFVVAVVCILIPALRSINQKGLLAELDATYSQLTEGDLSGEEREMRLNVFAAQIAKYKKAYPKDEENITKIERQLNILCGLNPDDPTQPIDGDPQEIHNNWLINNAREIIIDVIAITPGTPDAAGNLPLEITVKNCSDKDFYRLNMSLLAFDAEGKPAKDLNNNKETGYVRIDKPLKSGEEQSFFFAGVWNNPAITTVKLQDLTIYYIPNEYEYYFQPVVCEALWGHLWK